ncbi:MAG TPA: 5'/3'-nucleotidase SurE [Gammaproteobacteria bacterium]|nr:5'/3'-nucleotidase SurE [Gammaproteobacteria bacterium]
MRILLSNDDGYQARGLRTLAKGLADLAEVVVVAPDRNRSGASNSLTLETPLRVERADDNVYYVNGTPTDCVHIAVTGLLDDPPDMIVSGINHGANLGDDVLYSGTVAAAMEGRFLGVPAIAVSLVLESDDGHFATAAEVVRRIVARTLEEPLPADSILNVNVPDLPSDALRGTRTTRLGFRHKSEPVIRALDPKNRPIYWIGPAGAGQDTGPGTDFHAIAAGYVSVSPIKVDLTAHTALPALEDWFGRLR